MPRAHFFWHCARCKLERGLVVSPAIFIAMLGIDLIGWNAIASGECQPQKHN